MTYEELNLQIELIHNDWRSIKYIINKPQFKELWSKISKEEKNLILEIILKGKKDDVFDLLKTIYKKTLEELPANELKKIARQLKISNYSRLTRRELIQFIKEHNYVER